jgi:succinyl-CoA synthetase alpha subunit
MLEIRQHLVGHKTILIGPNTPGIITPDAAYMGIFPDNIHKSGHIGIISRSSTLTYEVILEINHAGFGESTVVGLGDDFIIGCGFNEIIDKFNADKQTKAIVLVGGIGGSYEIEAARVYQQQEKKKPVIALIIDDQTTLSNSRGLASEIISHGLTDIDKKRKRLQEAGMIVVGSISALKDELLKL